mmetsp:Transcript_14335/g.23670  ORF Transcript_14335/g.23670 Transcript_14335/m.23670 type:complete len:231 (-) Transcript_14335:1251-1943(-)
MYMHLRQWLNVLCTVRANLKIQVHAKCLNERFALKEYIDLKIAIKLRLAWEETGSSMESACVPLKPRSWLWSAHSVVCFVDVHAVAIWVECTHVGQLLTQSCILLFLVGQLCTDLAIGRQSLLACGFSLLRPVGNSCPNSVDARVSILGRHGVFHCKCRRGSFVARVRCKLLRDARQVDVSLLLTEALLVERASFREVLKSVPVHIETVHLFPWVECGRVAPTDPIVVVD